jgi:chromosome segregation ATPase
VSLEARREPGRIELEERRGAAVAAEEERGAASAALKDAEQALSRAQQRVGALEHDLDEARRQAFANTTSVSTLRNFIDRAREASERLEGEISRLDAEAADNRVETERVASEREVAGEALRAAQGAIETARAARAAREADLATARIEREWRVNEQRTRERELAGLVARLHSLEELQSAREGYTDAAKAILADASLGIRHHGAVVDAMEADSRPTPGRGVPGRHPRAVSSHDAAHRGLDVLRQKQLGRWGFVVIGDQAATSGGATPDGCQSLWSLLRVGGPHGAAIRAAIGDAWVAETFEQAARAAASTRAPIVTRDGDVFRGGRLVLAAAPRHAASRHKRGSSCTKRATGQRRSRSCRGSGRLPRHGDRVRGRHPRLLDAAAPGREAGDRPRGRGCARPTRFRISGRSSGAQ